MTSDKEEDDVRKLARLCVHNGMGAHLFPDSSQCSCKGESDLCDHLRRCPGGEFLPEGALVVEKVDGEWPQWVIDMLEQYHYPCPPELQEQVIKWLPTDLLDALASQVGESG